MSNEPVAIAHQSTLTKRQEAILIVAGGALGGLISVSDVWASPAATPMTFAKVLAMFVLPAVKGGVAAGIAAYLLASIDSTQLIRAFFFAVACGYTFPGILSNAADLSKKVTGQIATQTVADNKDRIDKAIATTAASAPELSPSAVSQIKDSSLAILQARSKVPTEDAKATDAIVQRAVAELAKSAASSSTGEPVAAIVDIGSQAVVHDSKLATDAAVQHLREIKGDTDASPDAKALAAKGIVKIEQAASSAE